MSLTKLVEHSSDSGESSKWKLAVALGVPIAVVSGIVFYWYWRSKRRAKSLARATRPSGVEDDVTRATEPVALNTKVRGGACPRNIMFSDSPPVLWHVKLLYLLVCCPHPAADTNACCGA